MSTVRALASFQPAQEAGRRMERGGVFCGAPQRLPIVQDQPRRLVAEGQCVSADRPAVSRVYGFLLGGKDAFAADRDQAGRLVQVCKMLPAALQAGKRFMNRTVTWSAGQSITQVIDVGCGYPPHEPVHETARKHAAAAATVYVDSDPVVILHASALLAKGAGLAAVNADLTDPKAVLAHPGLRAVVDPARPVCVLMDLVMQFPGPSEARQVTAGYARLLAPGSCIAVTGRPARRSPRRLVLHPVPAGTRRRKGHMTGRSRIWRKQ
jgi:hypothetical protein